MPYIPIPPPIRRPDMRGDASLTDEKRKYLKELGEWLDGMGDDTIFEKDGILREKEFFTDLIRKVAIIGSYTVVDRSWLTMITKAHTKWKRDG